ETIEIWALLDAAYFAARKANLRSEMIELTHWYPPLPFSPRPQPPLDTEPLPAPSFCEYQIGRLTTASLVFMSAPSIKSCAVRPISFFAPMVVGDLSVIRMSIVFVRCDTPSPPSPPLFLPVELSAILKLRNKPESLCVGFRESSVEK